MATATIVITDGDLEDEVRVSIHFSPTFDADSQAHELASEIMTDLQDPGELDG
jgi:hypothetical protein